MAENTKAVEEYASIKIQNVNLAAQLDEARGALATAEATASTACAKATVDLADRDAQLSALKAEMAARNESLLGLRAQLEASEERLAEGRSAAGTCQAWLPLLSTT